MATVRKLIVEVADARDLLPKDGTGTSSPYVVVDFDGQRKRTLTVHRDLNPVWNEVLQFSVQGFCSELLEVDVLHDRRVGPSRRNNFLGRVRLDSAQFVRKGEDALIYFPLEKKSFFSWIRGEIGLKIYYVDEVPPPPPLAPAPPPEEAGKSNPPLNDAGKSDTPKADPTPDSTKPDPPASGPNPDPPAQTDPVAGPNPDPPAQPTPTPGPNPDPPVDPAPPAGKPDEPVTPPPAEAGGESPPKPPENAAEAGKSPEQDPQPPPPPPPMDTEAIPKWDPPPEMMFQRSSRQEAEPKIAGFNTGRQRTSEIYAGEHRIEKERCSYDLVEKMHYLFVKIVKARALNGNKPFIKIAVSGSHIRTKSSPSYEWDQTFAFGHETLESASTLEVSVWDPQENFLGGICFDVSEIPTRDPPDSQLAPQWYRLEGGGAHRGDLMLATWIGTQADESFSDAWKTDTTTSVASRSKVYLSPKLWYLRATIIEAQDVILSPSLETAFSVKAKVGSQILKTRISVTRNGSPSWNEDLIFVAAEPFGDHQLLLSLENRYGKETAVLGLAGIPLSTIERRVDDRKVVSRWFDLEEPSSKSSTYKGRRLHVRLCFDGGYHVMDEPAHVSSDFRPTARQLWKPPIGTLELGIVGCRNLLPVKTVAGKGSTDAYAVAKYGDKWVRSRTVVDSLDPKWNEQYTWQVYDPCTVLTVGVFDNWAHRSEDIRPDIRIGKVRIRISTLENGKVYKNTYPLLVLVSSGVKKMGEIDLAVRFIRAISPLDVLHVYAQPLLPRMHYLKPIGVLQQEALRGTTARIVAVHLSRSEPPLGREVVLYMLDAESHGWFGMRKVRAHWARIANVAAGPVHLVQRLEDTRGWRNPTTTLLAHALLVLLVWHPDLIIPTLALYVFGAGAWNYRTRPRGPGAHSISWMTQQGETEGLDELDEELDGVPSSRPAETVRARYDKLRALGARVQRVLGDVATQGERVQALVTWQDPRATGIFVGLCLGVAVVLYVVPSKMVAIVGGFYYLRHPMFRDRMPPPAFNFFRRLPSLSDRIL
ncbi:C2 calcium/lipid-binding plant phosphoribosyltransferase family protein [Tasmannia lanceolata]|uniref:C2 calcium/lipid-binding plant phosphoribosyltransferase family protein n=1 Tax=Tasmannia lanceolata TaxID=3420 RepID=UPI0040627E9B